MVDSTLAVPEHPTLWAIGDCAAVTDAKTGHPCPPTAQSALREAEALANNIVAQLKGRSGRNYHFDSLGALCVVGHQTACAELTVPFARSRAVRFFGAVRMALMAGDLSCEIARFGAENSRAHGLDNRALFPT